MHTELFSEISKIAKSIKKEKRILVVSHYDADGLSAAGIIFNTLEALGKDFEVKIVKQLYAEEIEEIKADDSFKLFLDFGSGQYPMLRGIKKFAVLDHHLPAQNSERHANPWFFNIDGSTEISGSGLAFFLSRKLVAEDSLAANAIVGAVGDMQDSQGKLIGLNREIAKIAVNANSLAIEKDIRLYGRASRALPYMLCYSTEPILPGLTANPEACIRFIEEQGIELKENGRWRCYLDLTKEEKQRFVSALMMHLSSRGIPEWKLQKLIGEVYSLVKEEKGPLYDAREFATLLNACGRHGKPEIALAVASGDRGNNYKKALNLLSLHRKELREAIEFMLEKGIEERKNFYFFNAGSNINDSIVGIVAGMLYSALLLSNKPIIAVAKNSDEFLKVSARATKEQTMFGLHLGKIMQRICSSIDNAEGGGHDVAAGAKIPAEKLDEFLAKLEEELGNSDNKH
ncbi:MAG: DHH family phosphoesterase [Candidatus Diapherotrites archaeon]|nr:DHH family phosphoesterase [Candidatus Diapherotrites archaeon]